LTTPIDEYRARRGQRQAAVEALERRHIRVGNLRLATAMVFAALGWFAWNGALSPWWMAVPVVVFVALVRHHERVLGERDRFARAAAFYDRGIARLEDRWIGAGATGERFRDPSHPYAEDLDLFGPGGLFELLSACRTRMGEETLARWLLVGAPPEEIRARQEAVEELRPMLDLREDLAVLGAGIEGGVHPDALVRWAEAPRLMPGRAAWIAAGVVSAAVLAAVFLATRTPILAALAVAGAVGLWLRRRVLAVLASVEGALHDLDLLARVLERLERERFVSTELQALRRALDVDGRPPSRRIAGLRRIGELIDSRDNVALRIVGPPVLYSTHLAFAVERWRAASGTHVRKWLDALGEIEALASLGAFAYERPDYPFPDILEGEPRFEGEAVGHPLLAASRCVRNDLRLDGSQRLLIVSGSNMSGKSTLLRTVGVNAALALAGAPVCAARLRLAPMRLGASIRVTDSLHGGTSRFFAEIRRLRMIMDLAAPPGGLLFLLDELLHGTNSHDRRAGAEGVLRGFLDRRAIGLITTHDLALTAITGPMQGLAANVHFEDHLEGGQISFDYRLRDGVVAKSNALELMRSIGLEV
jgi:hypothetical protein